MIKTYQRVAFASRFYLVSGKVMPESSWCIVVKHEDGLGLRSVSTGVCASRSASPAALSAAQ